MKQKKNKKANNEFAKKSKSLWNDFKKFISRGNVLDMAVGVIIGTAFGAIVTSLVNILMSLCTWGVPGGIASLVTVLPAITTGQKAPAGHANILTAEEYLNTSEAVVRDLYVQHGAKYYYKGLAIIDWGALINAIISFLIIAITLFIIIKVAASFNKAREEIKAKAAEEYYKKHPEARPVPPEPGIPEPTTNEILLQIKDLLEKEKGK